MLAACHAARGGRLVRIAIGHAEALGGVPRPAAPAAGDPVVGAEARGRAVTVHFIGAGPGDPDLITVRGRDLIAASPVCLYAGSLVPEALLSHAPPGARLVDTQGLEPRRDRRRDGRGARAGPGRGPPALRRPVGLQRDGRADAPPRRARHPLGRDARGAGVRRRGSRAGARADAARRGADGDPRPAAAAGPRRCRTRRPSAGSPPTGPRWCSTSPPAPSSGSSSELLPAYGPGCPVAVVAHASQPAEVVVRTALGELEAAVERRRHPPQRDRHRRAGPGRRGLPRQPPVLGRPGARPRRRMTPRVLILGGTAEARDLAAALVARPGVDVVSSLAGRVSRPRLPRRARCASAASAGRRRWRTGSGARASRPSSTPRTRSPSASPAPRRGPPPTRACRCVALSGPGGRPRPGDRWHWVDSLAEAAAALPRLGRRAFLTTGRQGLAAFAGLDQLWFLVRCVDPPECALPPHHVLILDRGPYTLAGELSLFDAHGIDLLVTKDSGGGACGRQARRGAGARRPGGDGPAPRAPARCRPWRPSREAVAWLGARGALSPGSDGACRPSAPGRAG